MGARERREGAPTPGVTRGFAPARRRPRPRRHERPRVDDGCARLPDRPVRVRKAGADFLDDMLAEGQLKERDKRAQAAALKKAREEGKDK
jgi:hypothetical protein